MPVLECASLTKRFADFTAVDNVSMAVEQGSFYSILGPSGCGKTTLMRMLAGFERQDSGNIRIEGKSMTGVAPNRRPVNMVFQHLALFPNMSVAGNIAYGLKRRNTPSAERERRVGEVLERVGLAGSGNKRIEQLSGGQQQRVAIARCLVLNPQVLLLDEPLGALDLKLREHMKIELKRLQSAFGTTFIYITHDQSEALVMSDRVAVMNHGRFEQVGSPQDLYYRPGSAFVAGFVGDNNRWQGVIEQRVGAKVRVRTEQGLPVEAQAAAGFQGGVGDAVELFVRPEAIRVQLQDGGGEAENRLQARVIEIVFDGARSRLQLRQADSAQEILVNLPHTPEFATLGPGDRLYLSWHAHQCSLFTVGAGR
ncbi:MAG: ABC transporter ATP-binding protein [Gammaproteobacteria bacterium]|nr:ABC transporter ATP-binding protein [Gammaproteobacteria bacterium]